MSRALATTAAVIIALLISAYIIVMYICFRNQTWIFKPQYPQGPPGACKPLIAVTPITQDELANIQNNVKKANASSN